MDNWHFFRMALIQFVRREFDDRVAQRSLDRKKKITLSSTHEKQSSVTVNSVHYEVLPFSRRRRAAYAADSAATETSTAAVTSTAAAERIE